MNPAPAPRRSGTTKPDAGFSLIETIVALTLLAAMLAMVPGTLRLASRAWQAQDGMDRISRIASARAALTHHLRQAMPLARTDTDAVSGSIDFTGAPDAVAFVAPAPQSAASSGLVAYRLHRTPPLGAGRAGDLVMTMQPRAGSAGDVATPSGVARSAVILEDVTDLSLRYFGAAERGGAGIWQDQWRERTRLPELVEVSIAIRGAAGLQREVVVVETQLRAGR